jgi:hypothetical protein
LLIGCFISQLALAETDAQQVAVNPLRLSYTTGNVSFWRSGAEDWVEARMNTPIITGDALYTSPNAALELQAEGRMFIRADDKTELSLVSQARDFLQLKVASGRVSLDIRTMPVKGYNIELATPNAVFAIDRAGYYRVDVNGDVHFITRRGGAATMRQPSGQALIILPSEEIVVNANGRAETYVAPEPLVWDRWNDERSNELMDACSERYITPGIAGARDLIIKVTGVLPMNTDLCGCLMPFLQIGRHIVPGAECGIHIASGHGLMMRHGTGCLFTMAVG